MLCTLRDPDIIHCSPTIAPCKWMQHCWMFHMVSVSTKLRVVGSCCAMFESGKTFEPTTPNISFVPRTLHMVSFEFTKSYGLYSSHNELLHPFPPPPHHPGGTPI